MKAARIHEYGTADVISYEEVPRPSPGPGEVLIQVAAAAFNPSDVGFRSGFLRDIVPLELPFTLGSDVAGTVVEAGPGVTVFAVGDRVIGLMDSGGASAEFVVARAERLVAAPTAIPLPEAAAIPVAALSAWQVLFEHGGLAAGQRVLINGAGGGVGAFAVQLAQHAGATVIATASPRSAATVRGYGADEIIDHTRVSLTSAVNDQVDVAVNLAVVDPAVLIPLVRSGGVLISATLPVQPPSDGSIRAMHMITRNDVGQLAEIVALVDAGVLRVDVTAAHPLADIASVHRSGEAGEIRGKVILVPGP